MCKRLRAKDPNSDLDATAQKLKSYDSDSQSQSEPWFPHALGRRITIAEYLIVRKGGRQVCRFGGIIFNLSYTKALKIFYEEVDKEGIPAHFRHVPGAAPGCDATQFTIHERQ